MPRRAGNSPGFWFDTGKLRQPDSRDELFVRVLQSSYTGVILYWQMLDAFLPLIPARMNVVLRITAAELEQFLASSPYADDFKDRDNTRLIVGCEDPVKLLELKGRGYLTCCFCYVEDQASLVKSIGDGLQCDYVAIRFKDVTNIPLELVIASLQSSTALVIKEIHRENDVNDAVVSLGVMEAGADGIIFSPTTHEAFDRFQQSVVRLQCAPLELSVGTIVDSRSIGMGFRACIDTVTLFGADEGILVGSTSQGGLLCCAEVFFLPYMELRPFRVNAGAMHSYVYGTGDRTSYMSELRAGSTVMIVSTRGTVRTAAIGRMKVEQRPLRIIEVEFQEGKRVNVIVQDDWHVRIFSAGGAALNVSELKTGDRVLGYVTAMGRHVGIKIDEAIIEN